MAGETILVVDDNPMNLKLMRIVLFNEGYRVRIATNANEALQSIDQEKPHLIFVDIQMPEITGLELTRTLKSFSVTRDIPVVAISSNAMKGDREKTVAAGCRGYMTKPIDVLKLPILISEYLS